MLNNHSIYYTSTPVVRPFIPKTLWKKPFLALTIVVLTPSVKLPAKLSKKKVHLAKYISWRTTLVSYMSEGIPRVTSSPSPFPTRSFQPYRTADIAAGFLSDHSGPILSLLVTIPIQDQTAKIVARAFHGDWVSRYGMVHIFLQRIRRHMRELRQTAIVHRSKRATFIARSFVHQSTPLTWKARTRTSPWRGWS